MKRTNAWKSIFQKAKSVNNRGDAPRASPLSCSLFLFRTTLYERRISMLLFQSDYDTHSGIIDTNTKNYSFLRMAGVLQKMNIKNNMFFLYLKHPELQNYDPHNLTDPSMELRLMIVDETKTNPWYFFREVIRMPSAGGDPIRYILNRANLALVWLFLNCVNSFITIPRQTGKSAGIAGIYVWIGYFEYRNTTFGLFAKDNDLVLESIAGFKSIRNGLPQWMINLTPQDTDNKEGISYAALNNTYKTFIAKPELVAAKKQGRGERLACQVWDEFAFYKNNELSYPAATAASDAAQRQVRSLGMPASNIIATTAGRISEPSGAYAYGIKQGCIRFTERLYDLKNNEDLKDVVKQNSVNRMVYIEFSHKQLGFDDEWLAERIIGKPRDLVEMDYLNIWQLGTESSFVPAELLDRMTKSQREPVEFTQTGPLTIKWYIERSILDQEENKRKAYIVGLDTSDNIGKDFTTMVIVDPTDLTVIATCRCNISNFVHIVNCVIEIIKILPNCILIPERNKNGAVLIDILIDYMLKHGENPFRRIYNTFIQDYCDRTPSLSSIDLSDGTNRKRFGFNTSSSADSRDTLYGRVLVTMLNHMASRLFDADLATEIKGLVVRNGRIDHPTGCHDDLCIAMLLCGYFAFFGKNHYMYGIPSDEILKNVSSSGNTLDDGVKERQQALRRRITELNAYIEGCTNSMVKASYERELRMLKSQVDDSIIPSEAVNVEQVRRDDSPSVFSRRPSYSMSTIQNLLF